MKHRRKIWSIPIAALALVLMLAGALAVSGIVQAQTGPSAPSSVISSVDGDPLPPNLVVIPIENLPSTAGVPLTIAAVADNPLTTDVDETVVGFENPRITGAPTFVDSEGDTVSIFQVITGDDLDTDSDTTEIGIRTRSGAPALDKDSYSFNIRVVYDLNTGVDSNGDDDLDNDREYTLSTAVNLYILRISTVDMFHAVASGLILGDTVSAIGYHVVDNPRQFSVTGVASNAKISATVETGADNFELFDVGGNKVGLRVQAVPGAALTTDQSVSGNVWVDIDTAKDVPDDNNDPLSDPWKGDGNTTNDQDVMLQIAATPVHIVSALVLADSYSSPQGCEDSATDANPCTDNINAIVSIRDDVSAGHLIHTVQMSTGGAVEATDGVDEDLDGVISGDARFNINDDLSVSYTGGSLTEGEVIELLVTINGDTGIANRTTSGRVKVMVTATNSAPVLNEAMSRSFTIKENDDEDIDNLVKPGGASAVVGDLVGLYSDPEGGAITYTIKGDGEVAQSSNYFGFDGSKLIVAKNIADATPAEPDVATTEIDEAKDAIPPDGSSCVDDTAGDGCGNLKFVFKVNASDGVTSNDQVAEVTVIVDVNDKVVLTDAIADDLSTADDGVSFGGEDDVVGVKVHPQEVNSDQRDVTIIPFGDIVVNDDGDDLTYVLTDSTNTFRLDTSTGRLSLPYAPQDSAVYEIVVTVDDGYNTKDNDEIKNADGTSMEPVAYEPDLTIMAKIELEVVTPVRDYPVVQASVPENVPAAGAAAEVVLAAGHDALTAIAEGTVVTFAHVGGLGAGALDANGENANFSVDETSGEVTLMVAQDHEAIGGSQHTLTISVERDSDRFLLGSITLVVNITDVNEAPVIVGDAAMGIDENAQTGTDVGDALTARDEDGDTVTFSVKESGMPFSVHTTENADGSFSGQVQVNGAIAIADTPYTITVVATDNGTPAESAEHTVKIDIGDINDPPTFDGPVTLHMTIAENAAPGTLVATYNATDVDGGDIIQGLEFVLRNADDVANFSIENVVDQAKDQISGRLTVAVGANLEYDIEQDSPAPVTYTVEVNVCDAAPACNEIALIVTLENSDDEAPVIGNTDDSQDVPENSARGTSLGDYSATDKDNLNDPGFDVTKYSLRGNHAKYFNISGTGELMTLAALDYDRINADGSRGEPCVSCSVTVVATDKDGTEDTQPVTISVSPVEDSVSTLDVTKANPVPGTEMGKATSALAGTKVGSDEYLWNMLDCYEMKALVNSDDDSTYCKMWDGLSDKAQGEVSAALGKDAEERPGDLPVTYGSAPLNFVQTEWANWGTVLRIAVTSESPDANCDNGNQCVVVNINSDSADDSLLLKAYRSGGLENEYVAAVMLVEESKHVTSSDAAVYVHGDALLDDDPNPYVLAPRLKVDEEDEIEVEFGNLRGSVDVENEAPEISNFAPEHEAAFNDADVDYTFTVTDSLSGLPEPEDLPDTDGDENYTPVVALISENQCMSHLNTATVDTKILKVAAEIHDDEKLYCPGTPSEGEYIADETISDFGFAPIRDDKDFDEIDDGYDVETTIVLAKNEIFYVTFIACDNAGNCTFYDPDGNDNAEELAKITVDTEDPLFVEARTGLTWDSTDNEYDDNKSFIQVIFNDLTPLNTATVEIDDFVVEGHTIKDVHIFENPDDDDVDWGGGPNERYGAAGSNNLRDIARYRDIENSVFVELEDELLADETPDVTIVPNGVEDKAGNEQDDGDNEADDWISPTFTIVSIVSTRETSQDEVLAGDDDEVTVVVTADERLDSTRPTVTVTYVNATMIDTKGIDDCDDGTTDGGTRQRGEIVNNDNCVDNSAATGGTLNNSVEKVSNTEWIVTITEPKDTGYYNFHIGGKDRSPQENPGSEGVDPKKIVKDFFDADGDVNVDDAVFFEGDINLPKPQVRVSGVSVEDNEADVEFRSPLFVELDFARDHSENCRTTDSDVLLANCANENSEYAEDNFDDIVVTSFVLDGVDITDSVKTTDNQSFLISLESISIGDHTAEVQAVDQAGNIFEDTLEIDFEVNDRDPFEKRLSPGWNLVSLPGEPADSAIAAVFGPGVEVRTVYTYDPVIPGGWQVAVRETLDSDWQGDLTEINGQRGYWVLSDAIQDWEVSIPRLAGGAAGTGTPIQPPVIPLYAGWNLIPVSDISGNGSGGDTLSADVYLQSLDDGIDLARVLGFDTIRNQWETVLDPDMQMNNTLTIGSGYWIFVREATSLVPSGYVGGGGAD